MDKQTIVLIVLCLVLLVSWDPLLNKFWPPPPPPPPRAAALRSGESTNMVSRAGSWQATTTNGWQAGGMTNGPAVPSQGTATESSFSFSQDPILSRTGSRTGKNEGEVKIENDEIRVWITPEGGGIDHVELKKFSEGTAPVSLKKESLLKKFPEGTAPVLLNQDSPLPSLSIATRPFPFRSRYQLQSEPDRVTARLVENNPPGGLQISREYRLKQNYLIETSLEFKNNSTQPLNRQTFDLAIGMSTPLNTMDNGTFTGFCYLSGEKASQQYLTSLLKKPFDAIQPIQWGAVNNQYFVLLVTPSVPFTGLQAEPFPLPVDHRMGHAPAQSNGALAVMTSPTFDLPAGASTNFTFQVYAGPKDYHRLAELGDNQDKVMGFGMWEFFCKPLVWFLKILHGLFRNWGMAIISITVALKIIFWPLTAISTKSMKQMQALAPKINAMKEKYPDDPKKQNEEMVKLYQEYRINPAAGCLPMLIQIPIFFAFLTILRTEIELRGASFLWIGDLSRPDSIGHLLGLPINLMPILMAGTMIWQTRITPQAPNADPSMKMMMWLMPGMFLYFCYNSSSGLSLYWMVQNLLTILQTYLTRNQKIELPQKAKKSGGSMFGRPPK